jgi:hypothetical protein
MPTFADRGCWVVSAADPYGRNLDFLDWSHYFFQVDPQLYSWGWVDRVPDPLHLRKPQTSGSVARDPDTRPQRRSQQLQQNLWVILVTVVIVGKKKLCQQLINHWQYSSRLETCLETTAILHNLWNTIIFTDISKLFIWIHNVLWVTAYDTAQTDRWVPIFESYLSNRLYRPIGLRDVEHPTFSRQSAHRWQCGSQPYVPAAYGEHHSLIFRVLIGKVGMNVVLHLLNINVPQMEHWSLIQL